MLTTVNGYYDGSRIVLDSPAVLQRGQKVTVTYAIPQPAATENNQDLLVDSLVGVIPNSGKSLSEYRSERLKKYARVD